MRDVQKEMINEYLGVEQDFNDEYWQDENRVEMYLKAQRGGLMPLDADRYVKLYDLFGKDFGLEVFFEVDEYMYKAGTDIFEAVKDEENEAYKIIVSALGVLGIEV